MTTTRLFLNPAAPTPREIALAVNELIKAVNAVGGGVGNVTGPASSTDGNFAQFDGAGGQTLKDGGYSPSSFDASGAAAAAQAASQPLDSDLTALAGLSGTGFVVRTAANTYALRTIQDGTNTTVNNGSGVSGDPSIDASGGGGGSYIPLVDGSEPPNFITDGAGVLITVAYSP